MFSRTPVPPARPALWLRVAVTAITLIPAFPVVPVVFAQLPDPYTVPRGALRVAFDPLWLSYAELFNAGGDRILLGTYYGADSLGAGFFSTAEAAEAAVRSITGDASFRYNAGRYTSRMDADVRRFPFSLSLGLTSRLTFTATVPILTTRVKSEPSLDTTDADAGWNPASSRGTIAGRDSVVALLAELAAAAANLDAAIAAGSFGCPTSATCDDARALSARIAALTANLRTMTGVPAVGDVGSAVAVPPFAPLAGSAAGDAIEQAIADVSAALQAVGQPGITGALPLPTSRVEGDAVDQVLMGSDFGYAASPLNPGETVKLSGLGDVELGLRFGLATGEAFRAVLGTLVRLPTGKKQADPGNFLEITPADGQLDLGFSLEGALESSVVGLWFGGSYTLQFPDRLTRRVARADRPVAPSSAEAVVHRNLGDQIRASVHPTVRLSRDFRAFLSAGYFRKAADRYTMGGTSLPDLDALTTMEVWTFGGGLWFRMERNRRGPSLPIEAGFVYDRAVYGKGGTTPKGGRMSLSLRFFYNLWAAPPVAPENEESGES